MKQLKKTLFFFLLIIIVSVFIRIFIGEPTKVSSSSMEPTIKSGDWLWVNKFDYGAVLPKRWADIPLLNIVTWFAEFRQRDIKNNWKYHRMKGFNKPKVGDIVVFNSPEDIDILLVKRISQILHANSWIYLDSINYDAYNDIINQETETKIQNGIIYINDTLSNRYRLKNNYYYLLGDNASISRDSRFFGYISEENIIGKVNRVIFSTGNSGKRMLKKVE
ncbi:signal peptidase I [Petrimonas sp.]|uniref:signal peptidase I n=1 Tax=Petrimonas sp. TaxID=2023866 RepID=UPI003F50FB66